MKTLSTATIPPASRNRFTTFLGQATLAFGILFAIALVVYIALVAWLHHSVSSQAISITQAAGLPADAECSFRGLLSWLLAFAALPAFLRLVIESVNPFRSTSTILGRLTLLIFLGLALSLLPHGLRIARGVDHAGLPVRMLPSDPAKALWWNPDGDPVLFHSIESDGSLRFWNRPGITPDTGLQARPVTREIRLHYQQALLQSAAAEDRHRKKAEAIQSAIAGFQKENARLSAEIEIARKARLYSEAESARIQREREAAETKAREAQRKAELDAAAREVAELKKRLETPRLAPPPTAVPVSSPRRESARPAPSGWITRTLSPGGFLTARGVPNSRIEIRSDGRGLFHVSDGTSPQPFSGGQSSFSTSVREFRLVCHERHSFQVTYRWIPQ